MVYFQLTMESHSSTLKALKLYPQETVMLEERWNEQPAPRRGRARHTTLRALPHHTD